MGNLVGAQTRQTTLFDGGLDEKAIALVEIQGSAGLEVGLLVEPHYDKASWHFCLQKPRGHPSIVLV